ncbi:RNA polymerase sigma factor [Luteolibacter soli]|uniref:RNA polymerase sigma factor n=1 Tax=Luteolibacter soli TaxID=3135280 RepID=A0ABU9AVA8_9BACT
MENSAPAPDSSDAELLQAGYRYALALSHHHEEAEDLVQETWLNLCRRYGRVENRAILFSSIRNLHIDQCRRRKLVHFESMDHPDVPELADIPTDEPCMKGELAAMLGRLKPTEREVIFLHYYEGQTAEEISQLHGQSRGTVLSLIHRSIAKLRKLGEAAAETISRNQILFLLVLPMVWALSY